VRGTEVALVLGPALVRYSDANGIQDVQISNGNLYCFTFPPKVAHAFGALGPEPMLLVGFNTEIYDFEHTDALPDHIFAAEDLAKLVEGGALGLARSRTVIANSVGVNAQDPISRSGKATGSGTFNTQSPQAISATYYVDLATRDYVLANSAVELVIEGVPCPPFIEPSQSSQLIFCGQSDRMRGTRHISNRGKFRYDLQEY